MGLYNLNGDFLSMHSLSGFGSPLDTLFPAGVSHTRPNHFLKPSCLKKWFGMVTTNHEMLFGGGFDFHSRYSLSAGGLGSLLGFRLRGLLRHAFPAGVSHLPFQSNLYEKFRLKPFWLGISQPDHKMLLALELNFHSRYSLFTGGLGSLLSFRLRGLLRHAFPAGVSHTRSNQFCY